MSMSDALRALAAIAPALIGYAGELLRHHGGDVDRVLVHLASTTAQLRAANAAIDAEAARKNWDKP